MGIHEPGLVSLFQNRPRVGLGGPSATRAAQELLLGIYELTIVRSYSAATGMMVSLAKRVASSDSRQ